MKYPDFIDAEMQNLLDELRKAVVPRSQRKPVVLTNFNVPYYKRGRYKTI